MSWRPHTSEQLWHLLPLAVGSFSGDRVDHQERNCEPHKAQLDGHWERWDRGKTANLEMCYVAVGLSLDGRLSLSLGLLRKRCQQERGIQMEPEAIQHCYLFPLSSQSWGTEDEKDGNRCWLHWSWYCVKRAERKKITCRLRDTASHSIYPSAPGGGSKKKKHR